MKLNKGKRGALQLSRPAQQMVVRLALLLVSVGLLALGIRASFTALADEPRPQGKAVPEQHYFAGQAVSPGGQGTTPGRINGIKVAIPKQYQHFSPEYEGESPWVPHQGSRPERSLDSVMTSFSVYVQLPEMKPRSPETEASFQESFKKIDHPWVSAGVSMALNGSRYPFEDRIQQRVLRALEDREVMRKNCRFVRQSELRFGLVEYITQCPDLEKLLREEERLGRSRENAFKFYERIYVEADPKGQPVYIRCKFLPPDNKRGRGTCKHNFPVPELKVIGVVSYLTERLADWHDIQIKLQKLFASFRVESLDATPQVKPSQPHTGDQ